MELFLTHTQIDSRVCCLCADNQFRMSILERLEQMERRMAEMANHNQQQQKQQQQQQQQQLAQQQSTPHSSLRLTPENQVHKHYCVSI